MQVALVSGLCCALAVLLPAACALSIVNPHVLLGKHRMAEGATATPLAVDPELQKLSEDLYRLDQQGNAAIVNKDWTVNTRSQTGKLFTKLNPAVFEKPTYKALIALLDNYEPALGVAETTTVQEKQEEAAFLDAILATPVMKKAQEFLKSRNIPGTATPADFKKLLQTVWFTVYRRRGQPDTSGFEHAFVGEHQQNGDTTSTIGLHNWVQYAKSEAAGQTSYKAFKGQASPDMLGIQFNWKGQLKYKSTINLGESPEMSMAVNTVCFLVAPNNECKLKMAGSPVSILTYRWDTRDPKEFYVASAYYN